MAGLSLLGSLHIEAAIIIISFFLGFYINYFVKCTQLPTVKPIRNDSQIIGDSLKELVGALRKQNREKLLTLYNSWRLRACEKIKTDLQLQLKKLTENISSPHLLPNWALDTEACICILTEPFPSELGVFQRNFSEHITRLFTETYGLRSVYVNYVARAYDHYFVVKIHFLEDAVVRYSGLVWDPQYNDNFPGARLHPREEHMDYTAAGGNYKRFYKPRSNFSAHLTPQDIPCPNLAPPATSGTGSSTGLFESAISDSNWSDTAQGSWED